MSPPAVPLLTHAHTHTCSLRPHLAADPQPLTFTSDQSPALPPSLWADKPKTPFSCLPPPVHPTPPLLFIFLNFETNQNVKSIFVPYVTKYLWIIKGFSCVYH